MIFSPFHRFETGCAAYVFGCGGEGVGCAVDPHQDDVEAYRTFAAARGLRITHVFETHVHADHPSGGRELADRVGARYCLHRAAELALPFDAVDDDQVIELGNTVVRVVHTPGHTPESICLAVTDLRRSTTPWFVCTGDTLFVGAVGRPDLPGQERDNAAELHRSIHERLLVLPDDVEIYPAHFAGSACGAGMSGKPMSTIGFERRWSPLLRLAREAFIDQVGGALPPHPEHMDAILSGNRGGHP
jgi:glyoxylase-like metal-dependent hydrolase (beta-lactamase superfamily II)